MFLSGSLIFVSAGNPLGFQLASLLASGCRPITAVQCLLQATADMCCSLFVRNLVACADLNLGLFRSN